MSAENNETLTFVSLKLCFLALIYRHNELFFSYLWSFILKFMSAYEIRIRADEGRTPTRCFIHIMYNYIIDLWLVFMLKCMRSK